MRSWRRNRETRDVLGIAGIRDSCQHCSATLLIAQMQPMYSLVLGRDYRADLEPSVLPGSWHIRQVGEERQSTFKSPLTFTI